MTASAFDPTFDFRTDSTEPDPDLGSPTLKAYHKLLWSKPLPSGDPFELDDTQPGAYLHHASARGEFYLTSDSAVPTWTKWARMAKVLEPVPEVERENFRTLAGQMGGKIIFPGRQIEGRPTINLERGRNSQIVDRFDLTLECVRRHYLGETSPLAEPLIRYADFFSLFENFVGYTDFFILQDLISEDSSMVKFFLPFVGFEDSPLPRTVEVWQDYRRNATSFVEARNRRMAEFVASLS